MTPCPHCGAAATPDQRFCRHCGGALNEPVSQPTGGGVTGGVATADMTGRSCPYCRFPLKEGLPIQECGFCHTVHHTECWEENGGCCVIGCAGGPTQATQATQVHAATPGRPPVPPSPLPPFVSTGAPIGAPGPGKQIPLALAAVLAGVVAILGAGVALALSGSSHPSPSVTVSPVTTTETTPTETTPTETMPTETTTTNTAPTQSTPQPNEAPLAAVNEHWHDIQTGDYQGAWEDETPSLRGDESSWVHAQEEAGIESVSYQFEQSSSVGPEGTVAAASVDVIRLRTVSKQNGCQNWTGGYGLVNEGGTWRISHDSLESHRC